MVAEVDGGGEQVLRSEPYDIEGARDHLWEPTWSPDGRRIAYTLRRLDLRHHFRPSLYVMDANGGAARLLAGDASGAAWSPDGGRIAFASVRDRNGKTCYDQCNYHGEVYVMDADGSDPVRLSATAATTARHPGPGTAGGSPSRATATTRRGAARSTRSARTAPA